MTTHPVFPPTVRRLVPAVTAAVLAVGVAGASPAQAAGTHHRSTHHRPTLSAHVVRGVVAAPGRVHPGMARIHNTGRAPILLIARKHLGTRALTRELNDNSDAAPTRLARDFTVLDLIGGHADAYLRVPRGTLYVVPAYRRHFTRDSITATAVSGYVRNARVPGSGRVALNTRGLVAPARVPAHHLVHLVNNSRLMQEVVAFRPRAGVSEATIRQFVAQPTWTRLAGLEGRRPLRVLGIVARGRDAYVDAPHGTGRNIVATLGFRSGHALPVLRAASVRF